MKVRILGTAAAEGWPAMFCDCPACLKARELGGKNIRTRSGFLVDEAMKIDLGPDSYLHVLRDALRLDRIEYLLFTHHHDDHCCPGEMKWRHPPFSQSSGAGDSAVYAPPPTMERLKAIGPELGDTSNFHEIGPGRVLDLPPYRVTTIQAVHEGEHCLNYLVERDGRSFLLACDTGFYEPTTWEFLADVGCCVDLVIAECTYGPCDSNAAHLNFAEAMRFRNRADQIALSDANTQWVLTHFSHNAGLLHDEMSAAATERGFDAAFDGMQIDLPPH